jgi:hypothetical protein
MRNLALFTFLLISVTAVAQEGKTYTVNSIKDNKEELIRDAFRYPEFNTGVVHFKDGVTTRARLNYHRLFDQVLFIAPKGDTLALVEPGLYKFITIGTDTFYAHEKGYLERVTHYSGVNLARKSTIVLASHEKKGAYDTYSSTTAAESRNYYYANGSPLVKLQVDENAIYIAKSQYFLADAYNNFFLATKKNFYTLFNRQEKKLKAYLNTHEVNFNRQEDLLQLITYLQGDKE